MKADEIQLLSGLFRQARDIVFLTGAGMSTESGIPDFRSPQGLYASGVGEEVFDIDVFRSRPEVFYGFVRAYWPAFRAARPHAGHRAITALAARPFANVSVITQNIDTLHQDARNPVVLPVHGSLGDSICQDCGAVTATASLWPQIEAGMVPRHGCGGVFKPDVVFFGENLPQEVFRRAVNRVYAAELLVVCGTSLVVNPAGSLPRQRQASCKVVVINQGDTWLDDEADLVLRGPAGAVLGTVEMCCKTANEET
jgi:NAD-dependent deacetylase